MSKLILIAFSLICPFIALRLQQGDDMEQTKAELTWHDSHSLGLSEAEQTLMNDFTRAGSVARKISKSKKSAWIMFMGDSNMRNTFYWWTMTKLKPQGANFLQTKQFGRFFREQSNENFTSSKNKVDEWSDQDAIVEYPDGTEIRVSFRFLHGSDHEFKFKATNGNTLFRSDRDFSTGGNDRQIDKVDIDESEFAKTMDDKDAIVPSKYAQYAAKHQLTVDVEKEAPEMFAKFKAYKQPDAVILTEGWGGLPACNRFEEVLDLFKKTPETNFVWSPIYVTNRVRDRYECFAKKIADVPKGDMKNFRFVDMWDVAQKSGLMPKEIKQDRWSHKAYIKHIALGTDYMKVGCKRFEDAIEDLATTSPEDLENLAIEDNIPVF